MQPQITVGIMFRWRGTVPAEGAIGVGGGASPAPAIRRGRAPLVVITSVVALAALNTPGYLLLADSDDVGDAVFVLTIFGPGVLLVLCWLVRLVQWRFAARRTGTPALVTPHLAQSRAPHERGFAIRTASTISRWGGLSSSPKGYAVWLTWRDAHGVFWYQRVVWEPWLRGMARPSQAIVRRGPGAVTVIDVRDHGRLWPASFTLRRRPIGVRLTPFSQAHRLPEDRRLDFGTLAMLFVFLVVPCSVGAIMAGLWEAIGWWIAYVIALVAAVGTWFGIVPPGALPGRRRRGRSTPSPRRPSIDRKRR
ncbi:hypothetical protein ACN28C_14025 [Plantactinospora sp. WMMC1484]|uniref:hypothetical protein n=1 Tax=Plantactinospora sp. WMMC1484 TaxID=3404122 RepID=UPI003BF46828